MNMKKSIFTLIALAASILSGSAFEAGDHVYTDNGRYLITTGENLLTNGDFSNAFANWTTDSGQNLDATVFSVETAEDGSHYLQVLYKEDGAGTIVSLLRTVPVSVGETYYISYKVKADQEVETAVSTSEGKNYQNVFFNHDGSLNPETPIAKSQRYADEWKEVGYAFTAQEDGYLVIHIYGSYTNTCFADFQVLAAKRAIDDRVVNALIDRLQAYIDNPLFPNEHELLEGVIETLKDCMAREDVDEMDLLIPVVESDAIAAFLDENTVNITNYLENGTFDDLPTTGDNQTKAGAWIIDDKMRADNPTAKTRWSVKSAAETDAPFTDNYLQDNYPYKYVLREATVYQTLENMPAAQYMFQTKARAWVWKATDVINEDSVVYGLKTFINDNFTDCYPIHHTKATAYDAYGTLSEAGTLKIGFFLTDSVAAHVDLDVEALRIIGWTQDQADEYFMGREFAEAKQDLLSKINEGRELLTDSHYFYAKQLLTDSINKSQGVYDNSVLLDSINNQTKRMTRAITAFKNANAEYTALTERIDAAEEMLADESNKNGQADLQAAIAAARDFLTTLDPESDMVDAELRVAVAESITAQDLLLQAAQNAFMLANSTADEAYLFMEWAKEDINFIPTFETDPSPNFGSLYAITTPFAGRDLNHRFVFLETGLSISADAVYGLTVNLPGKNQNIMGIDNLKAGDQVAFDWQFANASHGLYVTSANASYTKADGTVVSLTETGKKSSNQLPRDDNQDGLGGYQRTTFTMNADGGLMFYVGSTNSTLRISYVGITYADPAGIEAVHSSESTANVYYDLQGRMVSREQMKRGLYIVNGKKMVIR